MDKYLVDVPVKVSIWIRPKCQRRQFEIIKKAKPSILFLSSDGGRNEEEWEAIKTNRKMYDEEIDWDCTVHRLYADKNNGLYKTGLSTHAYIWSRVDRCICLEDDILPAVSFFSYCAELLEKYKDDLRVNVICGMNHLGISEDVTADYFFSRQGSIWGFAMWRRTYESWFHFDYKHDPYVMEQLKVQMKKNKDLWRRTKGYACQTDFDGHVAGSEFGIEFGVYGYHQLQIVPKKNMISNIGFGVDSVHSDQLDTLPRGQRQWFNAPVYESEMPLVHPKYVFPDESFEKKRNRIMAYNKPVIFYYRKLERVLILIKNGRVKHILKKSRDKLFRRTDYEK